jgi:secreted trypsin-like serine protease
MGGIAVPANSIQHQFTVRVVMSTIYGKSQCGGTLISPNYVLTAAHCTKNEQINMKPETVILKDPFDEKKDKTYKVSQVITHPKFERKLLIPNVQPLLMYDFGILRLSTPAQNNNFFPCLPKNKLDQFVGANVFASGWGQTEMVKKEQSRFLKSASLTVIANMQCAKAILNYYGIKIPLPEVKSSADGGSFNFIICASGQKTKSSTCFGDSGGKQIEKINSFKEIIFYMCSQTHL